MKTELDNLKASITALAEKEVKELAAYCEDRGKALEGERQEKARKDGEAEVLAAVERARAMCEQNGIAFVMELPQLGRPKRRKRAAKKTETKKAA